jgi:hypothetical protein
MSSTTHRNPADQTNLSPSRTSEGLSADGTTIPAVTPAADRRSDSASEVANLSPIAPPALTSRRGFLMNTMVSAASLGTAAAVAAPLPIAAVTDPDAGLMNLIDQLWAFEPQYKKVQERFNLAEEAYLSRRDQGAEAAFTEAKAVYDGASNVISALERKMFATEARTLAGLKAKGRWFIQFDCEGDLDQIDGSHESVISLFRELDGSEPIAPSTPSAHPSDDLLVATLRRAQDVDLIELGKKFEPLLDRYYIAQRRWSSARARRSADALNVLHDEMKPLANAINAASVTSIEGLRVKALVALWEVEPLCKGDTEFSFDDAYPFQQLFMAVAETCGLKDKIAATGCTLPNIGVAWDECDEDCDDEGEDA